MNLTKEKVATGLKWAIGIAAVAFVAPVIFLAVQGLVGLIVAGVLGLTLIHGAPWLSMKAANLKLWGMKSEAARNPVETLQNQEREKYEALKESERMITNFDAEVATYKDTLDAEEKQNPDAAAAGRPIQHQMERLLQYRRLKYKRAQQDVKAFSESVRQAEAKYRVALAAQRVAKAAGETETSVMDKILQDVAFVSIQNTVNNSLAELRTAVMREDIPDDDNDAKLLEHKSPNVIEGVSVRTSERVQ